MVMHSSPSSSQLKIFSWPRIVALLMLGFICLLLILIVQVQHQVRHLETHYAKALEKQVDLHQEFGKLTLELHHLTALARVEEIAVTQLHMTIDKTPKKQNLQIIYLNPVAPSSVQASGQAEGKGHE